MKYLTTILLWLGLLIGEVHTLFSDSTRQVNWIISENVTMPLQWNVKYLTDELWFIIVVLALVFYKDNKINKTTCKAVLIFVVTDLLFYFWNFKRYDYEYSYLILLISWLLIYNFNEHRTKDRQGIVIAA